MTEFLNTYIDSVEPAMDFESKATYVSSFDGLTSLIITIGGALSILTGMIAIANFVNSVLTSVITRKKELAMLQSVGMTGRQVKRMLMYEGLGYSALGFVSSLVLSAAGSLTVVRGMGAELSYFTWRFTLLPVVLSIPPLLLITALVPLVCYAQMARKTVVERLRTAE